MLQCFPNGHCEFHKGWAAFLKLRILPISVCTHFTLKRRQAKMHFSAKTLPWVRRRKLECQGRRRFSEVGVLQLFLQNVTKHGIANLVNPWISGSVSDKRHPRRVSHEWPAFWSNLKKLTAPRIMLLKLNGFERVFGCFQAFRAKIQGKVLLRSSRFVAWNDWG